MTPPGLSLCSLLGCLLWAAGLCSVCTPVEAAPRRYALVVGVREYPASEKLNKLPYAEEDAGKLAEVLQQAGYDVTLMTQKASEGEDRKRFAPTATFLRKEFETLVKTPFLKQEDCLLVTLAGHGIQLPSKADPQQTGYFFCPADAQIDSLEFLEDVADRHNLISVDELYNTLKTSPAGVRLLVVDACRNDPNQPNVFRSGNSVTRPPVPVPPGGIAAFFSCSANEKAVEDGELKHGVFSHYLIEALSGRADTDGNSELSITEIESYVGSRTFDFVRKKYGRQQLPELKGEFQGWTAVASLTADPDNPQRFAGSRAGEVWDKTGLKLPFHWCPPGTFRMGSPESDPDAQANEQPPVNVTIQAGYWMARHEMTQAVWQQVMNTTPWKGEPHVQDGPEFPASYVTWNDALEFCRKLTERGRREKWLPEGWEVTLPRETQWEYACRAGTGTRFHFGDDETALAEFAWYQDNTSASSEEYPHQAGSRKPNAWGLHDMHGNLWEFCLDPYRETLSAAAVPETTAPNVRRIFRGGGWDDYARYCRAAYRGRNAPTYRSSNLGFRVILARIAAR